MGPISESYIDSSSVGFRGAENAVYLHNTSMRKTTLKDIVG